MRRVPSPTTISGGGEQRPRREPSRAGRRLQRQPLEVDRPIARGPKLGRVLLHQLDRVVRDNRALRPLQLDALHKVAHLARVQRDDAREVGHLRVPPPLWPIRGL